MAEAVPQERLEEIAAIYGDKYGDPPAPTQAISTALGELDGYNPPVMSSEIQGPRRRAEAAVSSLDEIIEIYKRSIDRSLLREQLLKTPDERVRELVDLERFGRELRRAGRAAFGD